MIQNKILDIQAIVSSAYGVSSERLHSRVRTSGVARARQSLMYLLRRYAHMSCLEVGVLLGRDHSVVLYGSKKAESFDELALLCSKVEALDVACARIGPDIFPGVAVIGPRTSEAKKA